MKEVTKRKYNILLEKNLNTPEISIINYYGDINDVDWHFESQKKNCLVI